MNESFLHYVWQFQYFNKLQLITAAGDEVEVYNVGFYNRDAGPDFFNAKLKIGDVTWVGNVEIHINSSDWNSHRHYHDKGYDNVILHVVWNDDFPTVRSDGTNIPTLELKSRVDDSLVLQYRKFIYAPEDIPCAGFISSVEDITRYSMLEKSLLERLERKAAFVLNFLSRNGNDWEETCYQLLARNFGFKVNADPFERLSRWLSYKVLKKHASSKLQIEAMLFGQAGFLDEAITQDEYFALLQREYHLLSQKFSLINLKLHESQWKFLRLRPANFPTLRLAQFAALMFERKHLFSSLIEASSYETLKDIFDMKVSSYWMNHYHFGKLSKEHPTTLGETSINNLIINTVIPTWIAYGKSRDEQHYIDKAVDVLQRLKPEVNAVVDKWKILNMRCDNAFDSQALLELNNSFCMKRKCLDCTIGSSLIRPTK